ncbi:molybdenum cofactor guanylyltransferase [Stetteria hydrogenophila]
MTLCAVLAGGASLRFGGRKLAWRPPTGGPPLLARVAAALEESGVCSRVVAVATPLTIGDVEEALGGSYEVVVDPAWLPCRGPIKGVAAAAIEAGREGLQLAAGDMAWLTPSAVSRLAELAEREGAAAAAPMWGTGFIQPLGGHIRDPGLALEACLRRGHLARPSDVYRAAARLLLVGSSLLGDRDGRTFVSANTPEELLNPEPEPPGEGLVDASSATRHYREARRLELAVGEPRAYTHYYLEALEYKRLGVAHLARHAWQDYCEALRRLGHHESPGSGAPLAWCRGRS